MVVTKQWPLAAALLFTYLNVFFSHTSFAAVLPEDKSEVLYHQYSGDGVTIDGPSVLVRKGFKDTVSVWGNYYTDNISGASIDLLSQGSNYYEEFREEKSIGFDYLHNRTTLSLSATNSEEEDYSANSVSFSVSQEFFGDMTTLSMNYAKGDDDVRRNVYENDVVIDTVDEGEVQRQRFGLGITQVLTRKWIMAFNAESVIDEGFLNNPYRSVRFLQGDGIAWQDEVYPETRNSDAFALRTMYYLPWKAAAKLEYRVFADSWGIEASNYEFRYTHQVNEKLILEGKYRAYTQTSADFFSDLFPNIDAQNFLARDKELSAYTNTAFGLGITYTLEYDFLTWFDKTTVNFYWDHILFDYQNFREVIPAAEGEPAIAPGEEPFFSFDANVIRLFLSFTY